MIVVYTSGSSIVPVVCTIADQPMVNAYCYSRHRVKIPAYVIGYINFTLLWTTMTRESHIDSWNNGCMDSTHALSGGRTPEVGRPSGQIGKWAQFSEHLTLHTITLHYRHSRNIPRHGGGTYVVKGEACTDTQRLCYFTDGFMFWRIHVVFKRYSVVCPLLRYAKIGGTPSLM